MGYYGSNAGKIGGSGYGQSYGSPFQMQPFSPNPMHSSLYGYGQPTAPTPPFSQFMQGMGSPYWLSSLGMRAPAPNPISAVTQFGPQLPSSPIVLPGIQSQPNMGSPVPQPASSSPSPAPQNPLAAAVSGASSNPAAAAALQLAMLGGR